MLIRKNILMKLLKYWILKAKSRKSRDTSVKGDLKFNLKNNEEEITLKII